MSWLTNLVDRIDAKLDRPADQTVLTDPRKRRSMRMVDQMTSHDESKPWGSSEEKPAKVEKRAGERSTFSRWFGGGRY